MFKYAFKFAGNIPLKRLNEELKLVADAMVNWINIKAYELN